MRNVAFIGLGAMGTPMAWNLHRAGFALTVWNRTAARTRPFADAGVSVASSPAEASRGKDVVVIMVSDPAALHAVVSGGDGVATALQPDMLVVNMSTVSHAATMDAAALVEQRGGRFVDAPVSGTIKPAQEGQLVVLAGARPGDVERAKPVLEAMGKAVIDCGGIGQATRLKLVLNSILAGMTSLLAEGLALGRQFDLDPQLVLNTLTGGALGAPFYKARGGMMLAGDFTKQFPVDLMLKDLDIVLADSAGSGAELPVTEAVRALFQRARERGLGDQDVAAVYRVLANE